jgi:hypothetical protein
MMLFQRMSWLRTRFRHMDHSNLSRSMQTMRILLNSNQQTDSNSPHRRDSPLHIRNLTNSPRSTSRQMAKGNKHSPVLRR